MPLSCSTKCLRGVLRVLMQRFLAFWSGFSREAFRMFGEAMVSGFGTNSVTVASVLGRCEDTGGGMQIHCLAVKSGFEMEVYAGTSLISMYPRCGEWILAARMFEKVPHKSVVTYNDFISGLMENGVPHLVHSVFNLMRKFSSEEPNAVTFINLMVHIYTFLLGACRQHLDPVLGEEVAMKLAELEPENPAPFVILSSL